MARHGNLADPDHEPTDEELQDSSRSAFHGAAQQHELALACLGAELAELSASMRARLPRHPDFVDLRAA